MKATRAQIEPWNAQQLAESLAWDEPQIWLLITPLEVKALLADLVSTRIKNLCGKLDRGDFEVPT